MLLATRQPIATASILLSLIHVPLDNIAGLQCRRIAILLDQANVPKATVNNFDDQGEPIRLAKGDDTPVHARSHDAATLKSSLTNNPPPNLMTLTVQDSFPNFLNSRDTRKRLGNRLLCAKLN